MQHRRRRLAVGLVLVAVGAAASWLGVAGVTDGAERGVAAAAANPVGPAAQPAVAVAATGVLHLAEPGWLVARIDVGRYELSFPTEMRISLGTWSAVADVTTRPVSPTTWLVTFDAVAGGTPVDSAFTFVASPAG